MGGNLLIYSVFCISHWWYGILGLFLVWDSGSGQPSTVFLFHLYFTCWVIKCFNFLTFPKKDPLFLYKSGLLLGLLHYYRGFHCNGHRQIMIHGVAKSQTRLSYWTELNWTDAPNWSKWANGFLSSPLFMPKHLLNELHFYFPNWILLMQVMLNGSDTFLYLC